MAQTPQGRHGTGVSRDTPISGCKKDFTITSGTLFASHKLPLRGYLAGTTVHADEAGSWGGLHDRFEMKRINQQEAHSLDGACTNAAEEYFNRLRRSGIGIHHYIAGSYLLRYAQESFLERRQPPFVER
jgi:hypothetical protein